MEEIVVFVGLCLTATIEKKPCMADNWIGKRHGALPPGLFGDYLSRNRFNQIKRFFYMNEAKPEDHTDDGKLKDPSHKVRPLIDQLLKEFMEQYSPGFHVICDEQSCPYCGSCCPYLQYSPAKPHPWAIRIYSLNCAKTKCCWKFEIFTGKGHKFPGETMDVEHDNYTACCLQ